MNLTASIGDPVRKGRGWKKARRHDVGDGRMLTVRQIAQLANLQEPTVYARIKRGESGVELIRPRKRKLFDVGNGRKLTAKEIAMRTGVGETAVHARIARGFRGADLLKPDGYRRDIAAPRSTTMVLACRLADAFPDRLPTTAEIRSLYPMVEQTAERWRTALRAARQGSKGR